jgi:hypothetical protein
LHKTIARQFFNRVNRKANWENPPPVFKTNKYITYSLKNGDKQTVQRFNKAKNYFWKYAKPLKYYFLKMQMIINKMKEKQLEANSLRWQIEIK